MHVEAEGRWLSPTPGEIMKGGWSSLNPRSGGRLQAVTNFSNWHFCWSENEFTTPQNIEMEGWSSLYSPV